ncbi:carboxymuconolactone decarboxylase family protein [Cupriavidus sp. WS]|uniref:carboxymuconolactone decarboxylase family protein n=1 Tax=Cupriavidus sp. WS TaxID=1312922 RepID=UPI000374AFC4|nr:carboxymuconolactone decarboxylase family protein [Cupriavidus sp. WS]
MNPHTLPHTLSLGRARLAAIEGSADASILDALGDIAPDLASLAIGFVYGEIYPRAGLSLPERQLVTVAALAAMGGLAPQLEFHLAGALNVGCQPAELVEAMIHLAVYAGFPAALNGIAAARAVFARAGVVVAAAAARPAAAGSRYEAGLARLREIDGEAGVRVIASLQDIAPDLGRFIIEFAFGDIYARPGLDLASRELVTVAALAAMGSATPQLKVHMHGLLNVGGTRQQLVEAIIQIAAYAGFPRAINAALAAREVVAAH